MDIETFVRRHPATSMVVAGVILLAISLPLWWFKVYLSPERAFIDMLKNNLTTTSVTKTISLANSKKTLQQKIQLQTGSTKAAYWFVTAKQGTNTVTTESIGTPSADYVRYTDISGKDAKIKKAYHSVLNVWGKNSPGGSLFSEAVLDVNYAPTMPIGSLTSNERQSMLDFIKSQHVFGVDYSKVKSVTVEGRPAYQYTVSVSQAAYVRLMQAFATDLGLTALQDVSASQYQNQPPATITASVDKRTHTLLRLSYARSGYSATYRDYGVHRHVTLPSKTIPLDQLKQRVTKLTE